MTTLTAPPALPEDSPLPGMPADPAADVLPPPVPAPDPAPYGVNADGTPKKKPGRRPGQRNGTGKAAQTAGTAAKTPGPPRAAKTAPRAAQKRVQTDYAPGLTALIGQVTLGLATFGVMKNDPALIADAATVDNAAPALVDSINQAADTWPLVAAICDKVLAVGPHAGGILAAVGLVGQLAVNHGFMPAGLVPGTMPREQLAAAYVQQRAAASAEFAAILEFARQHQRRPAEPAAEQPVAT